MDRLPDDIVLALRQLGLPHDRLIRDADLVKAGILPENDAHALHRMHEFGFPRGFYVRPNMKIYWPLEIGQYLLSRPKDKPTRESWRRVDRATIGFKAPLTKHERLAKKGVASASKTKPVKTRKRRTASSAVAHEPAE